MSTQYEVMTDEHMMEELRRKDNKIEGQKQEIHELKMNLKSKIGIEEHLNSEVENLNKAMMTMEKNITDDYERKISSLTKDYRRKIADLDTLLENYKIENKNLKEQLLTMQNSGSETHFIEQELKIAKQELKLVEEELAMYKHKQSLEQRELAVKNEEIAVLQQQLCEEHQLSSHRLEQCENLKEELATIKEKLEEAEEAAMAAKMEILALSAKPVVDEDKENDGKRGNSLFTEVEENRQAALMSLKTARVEILKAKQDLALANNQVSLLKVENARLYCQWKDYEEKEFELLYLDKELMKTHLSTIDYLEQRIKELEKQLEAKAAELTPDVMSSFSWLTSMMEKNTKRENELNSKIRSLNLSMSLLDDNRMREKMEHRQLHATNMRLIGEIKELKLKLEQTPQINPTVKTEVSSSEPTGCKKCNSKMPLPSFLMKKKEEPKSVRFAVDDGALMSLSSLPVEEAPRKAFIPTKLSHLQIATYNCRTLADEAILYELLGTVKWDIVGLSEIKRKGEGLIELKSGHLFYYRGTNTGDSDGVGFLIHDKLKNNVVRVDSNSDRTARLILQISDADQLQITQVCAPTIFDSDENVEIFYKNLQAIHDEEKCTLKMVMGDFSAIVGQYQENDTVVGKFGIGDRDARGCRLVEFAERNGLSIANTLFKKQPRNRWQWQDSTGNRHSIDYILLNTKSKMKNCKIIVAFRDGIDHRFVRCRLKLDTHLEQKKGLQQEDVLDTEDSN